MQMRNYRELTKLAGMSESGVPFVTRKASLFRPAAPGGEGDGVLKSLFTHPNRIPFINEPAAIAGPFGGDKGADPVVVAPWMPIYDPFKKEPVADTHGAAWHFLNDRGDLPGGLTGEQAAALVALLGGGAIGTYALLNRKKKHDVDDEE
jgi:hypothetical protein